jgi:hypothetical protein
VRKGQGERTRRKGRGKGVESDWTDSILIKYYKSTKGVTRGYFIFIGQHSSFPRSIFDSSHKCQSNIHLHSKFELQIQSHILLFLSITKARLLRNVGTSQPTNSRFARSYKYTVLRQEKFSIEQVIWKGRKWFQFFLKFLFFWPFSKWLVQFFSEKKKFTFPYLESFHYLRSDYRWETFKLKLCRILWSTERVSISSINIVEEMGRGWRGENESLSIYEKWVLTIQLHEQTGNWSLPFHQF